MLKVTCIACGMFETKVSILQWVKMKLLNKIAVCRRCYNEMDRQGIIDHGG